MELSLYVLEALRRNEEFWPGASRLNGPILASCGFSGCIMPVRGSAGNESESERLPFSSIGFFSSPTARPR